MKNNRIKMLFDELIEYLIENYPGEKKTAEKISDIFFARCLLADKDHYKDSRVYMHTNHDEELKICISSSIEILDDENIRGLFLHEIGHIIDTQMPEILEEVLNKKEVKILETNKDIQEDEELNADFVIERIFGIHIYYDKNKVQWIRI